VEKYIEALYHPIVLSYAVGHVLGDMIENGLNLLIPTGSAWKF
jgi:hypothetical protein